MGCLGLLVMAQTPTSLQTVLDKIEQNNTTLKALRHEQEADRLQNRIGLNLTNPEVEFHYLWGTQSSGATRKDFSVSQSIDWATLSGRKRKVAQRQNGMLDLQYRQEQIALRAESKRQLLELIYCNARCRQMEYRLAQAQILADGYARRMQQGDATQLDLNKSLLNLATQKAEYHQALVAKNQVQNTLQQLNGGLAIEFKESDFPVTALPQDFESWYAQAEVRNPLLQYVKQEIELNREQVKLTRQENLPSLAVGYMSERATGEGFQGITVGLAVPLWENKNKLKQKKAAVLAAQSRADDTYTRFYVRVSGLYAQANSLHKIAQEYRQALGQTNSEALLSKSLKAGEISLLNYIDELALYYDSQDRLLAAERDYQQALTELESVTW